MAYIGTQPLAGQYRKLDDISSGFNGATTSFTTSVGGTNVTAGSPQQLLVSLGGVIQQPTTDYTVNTSTIIFTTAPASGLSFFAILMGDALNTSVPADGSITSAKLAGSLSVGLAAGSASTPSLFFTGDTNTGIYSPGADQVAISTNGTQRLAVDTAATTSTLPVVHPLGAVGTPSITFTGDLNTGIWSPAADTVAASTGGSERLRIDSSGRVGIGTTSPGRLLQVSNTSADPFISIIGAASNEGGLLFGDNASDGVGQIRYAHAVDAMYFVTNASERARIDSSGRLLVGTSSARTIATQSLAIQNEGTSFETTGFSTCRNSNDIYGPYIHFGKTRGASVGSNTLVSSGDDLGGLIFGGGDGTDVNSQAAYILCQVDGTPGANDMPGRLVFSTTRDGQVSPTEALKINQAGNTFFTGSCVPNVDNTYTTGANGLRWSAVWAANGTINTSDGREKKDVADSLLGAEFIKSLRPVSYKWIEGGKKETGEYDENHYPIFESVPGTRTHWGFIAQEVKQAVDAAGVDFGGWVLTDKDDPDSQQALRYDQFIAPLTKALQEALAEIDVLKAKVAALETA